MDVDRLVRAVVEQSYDLFIALDADLRIVWSSPQIEPTLGYRAAETAGQPAFDFVHPDDLAVATERLAAAMAGEPPEDPTLVRLRHADGTWRWADVVGGDLGDDPDLAPARFALYLREVTHRERAARVTEEARAEAEAALRRSEERWRALVFHSTDAVMVIRADGTIEQVNPDRGLFGPRPATNVLGRDVFSWVHPDDVEEIRSDLVRLAQLPGETWTRTFRAHDRTGDYRWIEATVSNHLHEPAVAGLIVNYRDVTERKAFEARLAHEATHDPLTGLPNRTLLLDRLHTALARAERSGSGVAVIFVDLDQFKVLNDSRGHSHGDRVLRVLADRLAAALRPEDTVARFGGDEFVVVLEGVDDATGAEEVADRLLDVFAEPFTLDGDEVFVGASLGITLAGPTPVRDEPVSPEVLLREADTAMYRAKEQGRGRAALFDESLRARSVDRLETESALRRAVERDQFELWFQPIVDLRTGRVTSVEALLRWHHPERGLLVPAAFLEITESTGLVVPVGRWVLARAGSLLARWATDPPGGRHDLTLAVNLSGRQLAEPGLVDELGALLADGGADPARLTVEITESVVMEDVDRSADALGQLAGLGVGLAVDDFGTGYSSLAYLGHFPVDVLKIDRSFVHRIGSGTRDDALIGAIVDLAHGLDLGVVAEGVEEPAQLVGVREAGCDRAQGFLLAEPVTLDDLADAIAAAEATVAAVIGPVDAAHPTAAGRHPEPGGGGSLPFAAPAL